MEITMIEVVAVVAFILGISTGFLLEYRHNNKIEKAKLNKNKIENKREL